jgi:hypothetical protein
MAEEKITPIVDILKAFEAYQIKQEKELASFEIYHTRQEKDFAAFKDKISIIKRYKDWENPLTDFEIKAILRLTCYGHIGYCCGLQKTCPWRDAALGLLHITPEEYIKAKDQCQRYLLGRKIE